MFDGAGSGDSGFGGAAFGNEAGGLDFGDSTGKGDLGFDGDGADVLDDGITGDFDGEAAGD